MAPILRLAELVIKTTLKPLLSQVKIWARQKSNTRRRTFFAFFGRVDQSLQNFLNKKMMGLPGSSPLFSGPMNEDKLVEKGIDFFFELALYSLIMFIAINEVRRPMIEGAAKKEMMRKEKLDLINEVQRLRREAEELVETSRVQGALIEQMTQIERERIEKMLAVAQKKN